VRSEKSDLRRRLGVYALGVAVGLLLLGTIYTQRRQMAARQAAEQAQRQGAPAPAAPVP
jgi:hypothetical protein